MDHPGMPLLGRKPAEVKKLNDKMDKMFPYDIVAFKLI